MVSVALWSLSPNVGAVRLLIRTQVLMAITYLRISGISLRIKAANARLQSTAAYRKLSYMAVP